MCMSGYTCLLMLITGINGISHISFKITPLSHQSSLCVCVCACASKFSVYASMRKQAWMCDCMCVCVGGGCVHACICIYKCICSNKYVHVFLCIHAHLFALCMLAHLFECIHANLFFCVCMHIHLFALCMHAHLHVLCLVFYLLACY